VGLKLQKIGKRKIKVLVALLSLSIILSSFLTQKAYGTITKEYEYSEIRFDPDTKLFTLLYRFKVKVIIETEADGTWIPSIREHWYRIDFIITLDYVNRSKIESLVFYYPRLSLTYYVYKPIRNCTDLMEYSGQVDVLCFKVTAYPQEFNPRLFIKPCFDFNYTYSAEIGRPYSLFWYGEEPIYIDKKESPEALQPFSIAIIGIVIGVVIGMGSVLLGMKIGEKRAEKKKVNP
jgi:hypothetical protein